MIAEYRVVNDNLFEKFDKLIGQISSHKCLDGDRDVLGVLGLGQCGLNHLVDQGSAVLVFIIENLGPQVHITASDQVAGLRLEQGVLVAHGDQLAIAGAALIGDACKMGIAFFAIATDNLTVIIRIFPKNKNRMLNIGKKFL